MGVWAFGRPGGTTGSRPPVVNTITPQHTKTTTLPTYDRRPPEDAMLRNYLKTALRALRKRPGFTTINTVGLAVALACCLLVGLFIQSEWTYDSFHENSDRLYRAWVEEHYEDNDIQNVITPLSLGRTLEQSLPEVEETVRLYTQTDLVRRGERQFRERMHMADAAFFEVFDFDLLRGNPETVLAKPGNVVLTPTLAETYFGNEDPMGKTLDARAGGEVRQMTVTGVAEAPPSNSSIQYQLLLPFQDTFFSEGARTSWFRVYVETYVLLRDGASRAAVQEKMPAVVEQRIGEKAYARSNYGVNLQPITDIHLDTSLPAGLEPVSSPMYSFILGGIAFVILLIACINFMTLSVGRSAERAQEVGMRKALGANRRQLMAQFWGETLVMVGGSLVVSLVLARAFLPIFNQLAGRNLTMTFDGGLLAIGAGLLLVVGLIAGSYPAVVLSGLPSVDILRGTIQIGGHRVLRRALIGVQFVLSIGLIAGVLVMQQQLDYVQSKNLGFDTEQIVTLPTTGRFERGLRTYQLVRDELRNKPSIDCVTAAAFTPDTPWMNVEYRTDDTGLYSVKANIVTYDYIETMGIQMTAGRSFSRENPADTSRAVIVNQALVDQQGWTNPIGKQLPGATADHEIIGVTENFHYASLHQPVEPLVLVPKPNIALDGAANVWIGSSTNPKITIRVAGGDVGGAMDAIEAAWEAVAPSQPFSYSFLDTAVEQQYRKEKRMAKIVGIAAGLALFIACFGLLGLAAMVVQHRTREIGVRKALGASATQIIGLLSKEFAQIVAVAFVIAVPLAYLGASRWLENFAYHIELGPTVFVLAGATALGIALLTVSIQTFRAARIDPAHTLRSE